MKLSTKLLLIGSLAVIAALTINFLNKKSDNDNLIGSFNWTDNIPKEYLSLLNLPDSCCKTTTDKYLFVKTNESKLRNPVSCFYVVGKYYLQVYKMDATVKGSLKHIIKDTFLDKPIYFSDYHVVDSRTKMDFLYDLNRPPKFKQLYFNLFGDSIRVLNKTDTTAYYWSKCKSFSISFDSKTLDICGKSDNSNFTGVSLEFLFLKRKDKLYLFMLSARGENDTSLKPDFLYQLIIINRLKLARVCSVGLKAAYS